MLMTHPMKPDERLLAVALSVERQPDTIGITRTLGIPEKRWHYLLDKWADNGRWEYGVSLRTGWWTADGRAWLISLGITPGWT